MKNKIKSSFNPFKSFADKRKSKGISLVESILVIVITLIVIAGVYGYYRSVSAAESVHRESQAISEMTKRISSAYNSMPNFSGINHNSLISSGAIPSNVSVEDSRIYSSFGGEVLISSENGGDAFSITYQDIPRKSCNSLVSSVNAVDRFKEINVFSGQQSRTVAENGRINEDALSSACRGGDISFQVVYERVQTGGTPADLGPCTLPSPSTQYKSLDCRPGYAGEIIEERTASCSSGSLLPVWSDWTLSEDNCAIICTPHPTSPETRVVGCGDDYVGNITERRESVCPSYTGYPDWSDWSEINNTCELRCSAQIPSPNEEFRTINCQSGYHGTKTERRTFSCPTVTGTPLPSAWSVTEDNCQVLCNPLLPVPNPETRWLYGEDSCPAQYSGSITYEYEQSKTWSCPAGSPSVGQPIEGDWSTTGNRRNINNTCTEICHPETQLTRWVPRTGTCPGGAAGTISWQQKQVRTSVCEPGNFDPTTSAWQDTDETRSEVNGCTVCPSNQLDTETDFRWSPYNNNCANGQFGRVEREREQRRVRTRTGVFNCPAGTISIPPISWGDWGIWSSWSNTGQDKLVANNCEGCPGPETESKTENRWHSATHELVNCPANQYGYTLNQNQQKRTGTRTGTYSCPSGTQTLPEITWGAWSWGSWSNTGQTRVSSNECKNCPTGVQNTQEQFRWSADYTQNCPANQYGQTVREREQKRTRDGRYVCPAGTKNLPGLTYGDWSSYANTGTTRHKSGSCTNCPGPQTDTQTQTNWQAYESNNCPANQYGYSKRERERVRTRTRTGTYNCPAGTKTLPAISWGSWGSYGPYSNTGTTRLVSRHCSNCGTPPQLVETRSKSETSAPRWVNGTGTNVCRQYEQTRVRTGTERRTRNQVYNCPAGTRTRPAPTPTGSWSGYTHVSWNSWGAYSNTGATRNRNGHTGSQSRSNSNCPMGQQVVPGGEGEDVNSYTCSGGNQVWSGWQTIRFPQCCIIGMTCNIH